MLYAKRDPFVVLVVALPNFIGPFAAKLAAGRSRTHTPQQADRPQSDRGPRFNENQMTSRGPAKPDNGGGAFAEAMRRAAERNAGKAK